MIESFEKISSLVKQFEENREDYHSKKYDESNTRTDFIDKFFEALGWDVRNNQGHAENYREVIREDKIMIEGKQKAPDYAFRIGGTVKFYVEAKKPSVDIKNDIDASYQLRRYAYTAKLPLSILTDFAEFAVYDTRIKPKPTDNASVARIFYCKSSEYEKQWEFIEQTFAKEAILKGSFDKYIKDPKRKKGTSEVDKEFLKQIESWREDLALNIALRNKDLSIYDLNFAIQKIIDRIIFLRIAEDRGMEEYGALRKLSQNSETKFHIYAELVKYFKKADEKYNSGLFDLKEDKVTTKLTIDYKIFANIIDNLYYPNSPYEFSVLPIEILGNIYEQFLGKTIRLTEGHRAKVEDKPEVRKAGGVYYTPQYIVDYIVKNTLGEKLKEKTPKQIEDLTVLDPACGSGSFLITAYEYLLNFYLDYYSSDKQRDKALKDKKIFEIGERGYKLGIDEKKEILTRHIYGVDIDSQAVEVTKLSLLLKLMEDERLETSQYLFTRRAMKLLPDLSSNIKCGNSLIGSDFYTGQQVEMFDDEMVRKINAFDWDKQFPSIFSRGGFDVVIGNPPYVFTRDIDWSDEYKNYIWAHFNIKDANSKSRKNQAGKINLYILFILKSIKIINKLGLVSMIIPNGILRTTTYAETRKYLLQTKALLKIVDIENYVFEGVTSTSVILVLTKRNGEEYIQIVKKNDKSDFTKTEDKDCVPYNYFLENVGSSINVRIGSKEKVVIEKIDKQKLLLKDITEYIIEGVVASKDLIVREKINNTVRLIEGKDLEPFKITFSNKYLILNKEKIHRLRPQVVWDQKTKLIIQRISGGATPLKSAVDYNRYYSFASTNVLVLNNLWIEKLSYEFLCAILNSKLINFYYTKKFTNSSKLTVNISRTYLEMIPIPITTSKDIHQVTDYVLKIQKELNNNNENVDLLKNELNRKIYSLYNLTSDEIEIVEKE